MPAPLTDNFNSYTDGDLNGQGGWNTFTPSGIVEVEGTIVYEGAKAIKFPTSGGFADAFKDGSNTVDGKQTFSIRRHTTDPLGHGPNASIFLNKSNGFSCIDIEIDNNDDFVYWDGNLSGYTVFGHCNEDTWYAIQAEWRSSDHKIRYNVNGGTWTNWFIGVSTWSVADPIFEIDFQAVNNGAGDETLYIDTLQQEIFTVTADGNFLSILSKLIK